MFQSVLDFWFQEIEPSQWWKKDQAFDELIGQRFGVVLGRAAQCEFYEWRTHPAGRLAEIIVLDQFSRNVYRDTPAAFAQDPLALALAQEAVSAGALDVLSESERTFLLMPYMHSESAAIHVQAEKLFKVFTPTGNYEFELKHKLIIDRFGRYPHRNAILGRQSTSDELEFLQQPGSSF
jgi:uncharacterized protein (DUF924 family)